jgi:hypothetical protein
MSLGALAGLRNLRTAFLTGALLLGSLYVIFGPSGGRSWHLRQSAQTLAHLWAYMPLALAILGCVLAGSLYTTGLEGFVDWLHRRYLACDPSKVTGHYVQRRFIRLVGPLSPSARTRLTNEAARFYDENIPEFQEDGSPGGRAGDAELPSRDVFVNQVLADILWLEGKLVGTALKDSYDQYRAEGELRLSTALLLPLVAVATCSALDVHGWRMGLVVSLATLLALKLADYGLYYFRRAHSFLAHHIADGLILTPSMETMRRSVRGTQDHDGLGGLEAANLNFERDPQEGSQLV